MHCQNCGKENTQQSNFCRFCGTKFAVIKPAPPNNYIPSAPPVPQPMPMPQTFQNTAPVNAENIYENMQRRPYSWKTDEYQISEERAKTKPIDQVTPLPAFQPPPPHMAVQPYQPTLGITSHIVCPRCARQNFPVIKQQVSTAGWITFAVLLVTIFPLFWIGLLIKEDAYVCPVCNFKYR